MYVCVCVCVKNCEYVGGVIFVINLFLFNFSENNFILINHYYFYVMVPTNNPGNPGEIWKCDGQVTGQSLILSKQTWKTRSFELSQFTVPNGTDMF